jgi:hypothetical protein
MDILKILEESAESLYPEDLDFFETELATGGYKEDYVKRCRSKIIQVRKWMNGETDSTGKTDEPGHLNKGKVFVPLSNLAPENANAPLANKTPIDLFKEDLANLRHLNSYKSEFKKFIASHELVDADFVDKNYGLFEAWEIGAIISVKQMGEPFLEKYFGALDLDKVARYQEFSEQFFMKHFSQLDATIVLTKGKNAWRKKENRSKQLDVFLRLKGIKL